MIPGSSSSPVFRTLAGVAPRSSAQRWISSWSVNTREEDFDGIPDLLIVTFATSAWMRALWKRLILLVASQGICYRSGAGNMHFGLFERFRVENIVFEFCRSPASGVFSKYPLPSTITNLP